MHKKITHLLYNDWLTVYKPWKVFCGCNYYLSNCASYDSKFLKVFKDLRQLIHDYTVTPWKKYEGGQ